MIEAHAKLVEQLHAAVDRAPVSFALQILTDAADAIELLSGPLGTDHLQYALATSKLATARAEYNSASRALDLAQMRERCAEVMSQHEPLAGLGLDREKVRQVLQYVQCGRLK